MKLMKKLFFYLHSFSLDGRWNLSRTFADFTVNYKVELYDPRSGGFMPSSPGIGMHVEIKDSDDKPILSRVYSSEGRISFTSHTPGEHVICLYSNSSAWFSGTQLVKIYTHYMDVTWESRQKKENKMQKRHYWEFKWYVWTFHLQRVHLDIQVGEHAIDYANVAQKEKLSELQLRIRQLLDQVGQITKEQNYQRVIKSTIFVFISINWYKCKNRTFSS